MNRWLIVPCILGSLAACDASGSNTEAGNADVDAAVTLVPASRATPTPDGLCTSCGACEEDITIASERHVDAPLQYADPPPAGGDHNPCWWSWGPHTKPVPDERWVHNLEHGGVVYLYNCPEGCAAEVEKMSAFVTGRAQALLSPYPDLPVRFAVVSWGHRIVSDCFDQTAFEAFYTKRVDQAPESVPDGPPASCPTE